MSADLATLLRAKLDHVAEQRQRLQAREDAIRLLLADELTSVTVEPVEPLPSVPDAPLPAATFTAAAAIDHEAEVRAERIRKARERSRDTRDEDILWEGDGYMVELVTRQDRSQLYFAYDIRDDNFDVIDAADDAHDLDHPAIPAAAMEAAVRHFTGKTKKRGKRADLTPEQQDELRKLIAGGMSQEEAGAKFGVSRSTAGNVVRRKGCYA